MKSTAPVGPANNEFKLISAITGFVADKDGKIRAMNNSGKPIFSDPQYFGTNDGRAAHKGLAVRVGAWWMRCLIESKLKVFQDTGSLTHYTGKCKIDCPCKKHHKDLPQEYVLAEQAKKKFINDGDPVIKLLEALCYSFLDD